MLSMYCNKMKAAECSDAEERSLLQKKGLQVPLMRHACIHDGAKECKACKELYVGFT